MLRLRCAEYLWLYRLHSRHEERTGIIFNRATWSTISHEQEALRALRLVWPARLQTLHSVGLIVDYCIFFIVLWWLIVCGRELVAKNGVQVGFNVIFGAKIVIVIVII
jgi:hypothetical protein